MTQVSIAEAARLVGRDRKTVYNAVKSGRLSATVDSTGTRQVDIAELVRVFGELRHNLHSGATVEIPQRETPNSTAATAEMAAKLAALEAENAQLKERLAEAKERQVEAKEHMRDLRQQVLMLRDMREPDDRPFWRRWFGG